MRDAQSKVDPHEVRKRDGGNGDDLLIGDAGANTLEGDVGDDRIDGRSGNDYLLGDLVPDTNEYSVIYTRATTGPTRCAGVRATTGSTPVWRARRRALRRPEWRHA